MNKDLLLGVKFYFAREGSTVGATTVADNAKPDFSTTPYPELGCIEQWEPINEKTEIKRRCATNGKWGTRKTIITGQDLTHNFSMQEWDEMTFSELLLQSETPVSGDFVSNTGQGIVRGWGYIIGHNYDGEQIVTIDDWMELSVGSYQFTEGLDPFALKAQVLANSLNAGNVNFGNLNFA